MSWNEQDYKQYGNIKSSCMSAKNDKKMRQMFRSEIRDRLEALTDEYFGGGAPVFNPKPRFCPVWLWKALTNFIIDRGFLLQYEIREKNKKAKPTDSSTD